MDRNEIFEVMEYPNEDALKEFLKLFPQKMYYQEIGEDNIWEVRNRLKKAREKEVKNIIHQLWGHIEKKTI